MDRLTQIIDFGGKQTQYEYNKNGVKAQITDGNMKVTQYKYDEMDRRTTVILPGNDSITYIYGLNEEVLKVTEDELKSLQEIVSSMNGATTRVGQIETQKHMVLHDLSLMRTDLMKLQGELEAAYGKVDVNIQDGTITVREDVEADTKD